VRAQQITRLLQAERALTHALLEIEPGVFDLLRHSH